MLLAAAVCCLAVVVRAVAEPVTVVRTSGPDDNRINFVILGDGYTSGELTKYSTDVDLLLADLFRESPFAEYLFFFNVRRIDVVSNESGADHPADGVFRDTALGAAYDCNGIAQLICVDHAAVYDVLERSVAGNLRDIVLILVNDNVEGGAGGAFVIASTSRSSSEVMLHELGHALGLLADEYTSGGHGCDNSMEPPEVNVTRESMRNSIKWSYWIDPDTPVPAAGAEPGVVSAYEGARYCESGLYRPTFNSKMRSLGQPFGQVNTEQLIRRLFNWVSPIESVRPPVDELTSDRCEPMNFFVQTVGAFGDLPGRFETTWRIDGEVSAKGNSLTLISCLLSAGRHDVEVEVRYTTSAVRRDPNNALVERHRWSVLAPYWGEPAPEPKIRKGR